MKSVDVLSHTGGFLLRSIYVETVEGRDAHLSGVISQEEYSQKKQKILNQKIEISEKLRDFEQKGYSWLEPAKKIYFSSSEGYKYNKTYLKAV